MCATEGMYSYFCEVGLRLFRLKNIEFIYYREYTKTVYESSDKICLGEIAYEVGKIKF